MPLAPILCKVWWQLVLLQGLALGVLGTVGTLCMASHYRNKSFIGLNGRGKCRVSGNHRIHFLGIFLLSRLPYQQMCIIDCMLTVVTLGLAIILIKRDQSFVRLDLKQSRDSQRDPQDNEPTVLFIFGYIALFFGLFVWLTFMILVRSSSSGQTFPTEPTKQLLSSYTVAFAVAGGAVD
jgi:hypothetical protein